jgi:hypothetical protein
MRRRIFLGTTNALLPTIETSVALSEVERAEEKNTPGTPESAFQRDSNILRHLYASNENMHYPHTFFWLTAPPVPPQPGREGGSKKHLS